MPPPCWHKLTVLDQQEQFPEGLAEIELAVALAGATKATAWFDDLQLTTEPLKPGEKINLAPNGDMEDALDGLPSGWGIHVAEGGEVEGKAVTDEKHGGERSLHLAGKGEWDRGGHAANSLGSPQAVPGHSLCAGQASA